MKATIEKGNPPKEKEIEYPCLMKTKKGKVVLFKGYCRGTVLISVDSQMVGYFSDSWRMSTFHPLPTDQKVILQND